MAGKGELLKRVTASAPTNIAVIKYWGKRDEDLILPLNSSLSVTLNPDDLAATTTVAACPAFEEDRLWLNGKEVDLSGPRYQRCLKELRARARDIELNGKTIAAADVAAWPVHIASRNNFPTAAGLASSAAGFACLVYALAKLYEAEESFPGELSTIARLGSGSACRSLYGGFVRWDMGQAADGHDSIAEQVAPANHWPSLCCLVAVVSDAAKDTSSTAGMQQTVRTSALLAHRARGVVPERLALMERAVSDRDFETFGKITMADSNQFHATCLDTSPPIFYLNDTSRRVIQMVERWNAAAGRIMAAYTFDAGPNAVVFCLSKDRGALLQRLLTIFPPGEGQDPARYFSNQEVLQEAGLASVADHSTLALPEELQAQPSLRGSHAGALRYILSTRVGEGPKLCEEGPHLLDSAGQPEQAS